VNHLTDEMEMVQCDQCDLVKCTEDLTGGGHCILYILFGNGISVSVILETGRDKYLD
jgi:hypothetical protein